MTKIVRFSVFGAVISLVLLTAVSASGGGAKSAAAIPAFTVAQLSASPGANWISQGGNIMDWRHSTLTQISAANGASLKTAWTTHLDNPATPERLAAGNANPIIYNGTMYVQDAWTRITALDAVSGKSLWQFDPVVGLNTPGNGTQMRSIGMGDGMIFTGAYGTVYGINAKTGAQVWATQVVNPVGGGGIDVSPIYYKGTVVIGTTGGDWGGACIGVGLDAKTGKVKWHYSFIPSNPKAYGWKSWPVNRNFYGGAAVWDEPAIDPTTGYALFGTGQPQPFNGLINGPGAELGTDGVYALDALTGKFKWFYQEVHHDIWDFDGMQTPKPMTLTIKGKKHNVVVHINKNALYFVLDSLTGKPVIPAPEMPVPQDARAHTYPTQPVPQQGADQLVPQIAPYPEDYRGVIAPDGKPYKIPTVMYEPYTDEQYVVISPTANGGVQWMNGSFDPTTGYFVVCTNVQSYALESPPAADQHPVISNAQAIIQWRTSTTPNSTSIARLVAFNPATNKIVWKFDEVTTGGLVGARGPDGALVPGVKNKTPCNSNVTTTANGLSLIGRIIATPDAPQGSGHIQAFNTKTGELVWQKEVLLNGSPAAAVPRLSTYSVNGKQYLVSFFHHPLLGADITAFTLP